MSYYDIYKKRLNRYGNDYQSRVQGQRERFFEEYLLKTLYRVDFEYNNVMHAGSLERYKQDSLETIGYLLTKIDLILPGGTILDIISQDGTHKHWMVWWLEHIEASGYNKYIMLRMTHELTWANNGTTYSQWFHFKGPGSSVVRDVVKTSSTTPVYSENDNKYMLITNINDNIKKGVYFEVGINNQKRAFVVLENDIHSTPGIGYYIIDPTPIQDITTVTQDTSSWLDMEV